MGTWKGEQEWRCERREGWPRGPNVVGPPPPFEEGERGHRRPSPMADALEPVAKRCGGADPGDYPHASSGCHSTKDQNYETGIVVL